MQDIPVWLRIGVGVFITILGVAIVIGEPFVITVDLDKIPFDIPKGGGSIGGIAIIDDSYTGTTRDIMIQHEAKHTWQYGITALLSFPILYFGNTGANYLYYQNISIAYDENFFEKQAYSYQFWYSEHFFDVELEVNF